MPERRPTAVEAEDLIRNARGVSEADKERMNAWLRDRTQYELAKVTGWHASAVAGIAAQRAEIERDLSLVTSEMQRVEDRLAAAEARQELIDLRRIGNAVRERIAVLAQSVAAAAAMAEDPLGYFQRLVDKYGLRDSVPVFPFGV